MQHGNCEKRKIVILELGNILDRKKHHSAVIVYSAHGVNAVSLSVKTINGFK